MCDLVGKTLDLHIKIRSWEKLVAVFAWVVHSIMMIGSVRNRAARWTRPASDCVASCSPQSK